MIFNLMMGINENITEEWCNPNDDVLELLEKDKDEEIVNLAIGLIDRFISVVGEKILFP
jgi:hypothetical protein